jgi:hypothetical protein
MKKLFLILVLFATALSPAIGQLRLSEVANQSGESYIEMYSPSSSSINLNGYFFAVKVDGSATWSVIPLGNTTIGGADDLAKYFVLTQTAPGGKAPYTRTDLVSPLTGDFLVDNKGAFVFLIGPNNKVVDLFAAHSSQSTASTEIQLLGTVIFTVSGQQRSVNFSTVEVSPFQFCVVSQLGANSSYSLTNDASNVCGTWLKTSGNSQSNPGRTPESKNQNALANPDFDYFTYSLKYDQNPGVIQEWTVLNELAGLPSQNGSNLSTATNFEYLFRYEITNTNLSPISSNSPALEIWVDQNEDKIFVNDPAAPVNQRDLQLTLGTDYQVSQVNGSTSVYEVRLLNPAGPKIKIDATLSHNLFFKFRTTAATCFERITEMIFQAGALPAALKHFSLKSANAGKTNQLNWSVSTESNNKGFEIQRSMGNTNDFKTIGFVATKAKQGNSDAEISYSFEDADVKTGQIHYYRLNQIDYNGKSALSAVKSIRPGSIESNLNVYPNPSQGSFTVNTGSASGKLNIIVMDNTGRVVNQYINVSTTNTKISNLKKGFYTLKIVNIESGEQSAQRVVVQ